VVVTFATGFEPVTAQGGPAGGTTGTINGVSGVVTLSSGTYTFTRSVAGSAVAASGSPQFIPTIAFPYAPELIWAGANNFPYTAQILSDVEAMAAKDAALGVPSVVLSVIPANNSAEWYGGSSGHYFPDINNQFASVFAVPNAYESAYANVLGDAVTPNTLIYAACTSPYPNEQTDCTHKEPPTSFRAVNGVGTITSTITSTATSVPINLTAMTPALSGVIEVGDIITYEPLTANAQNAVIVSATGTYPNYTLTVNPTGFGGAQVSHSSASAISISDSIHLGPPYGWTPTVPVTPNVWNTIIAPVVEAAYKSVATQVFPSGSVPAPATLANLSGLLLAIKSYRGTPDVLMTNIASDPWASALNIDTPVLAPNFQISSAYGIFDLGANGWFQGATNGNLMLGENSANTGTHLILQEGSTGNLAINTGILAGGGTITGGTLVSYGNTTTYGNMQIFGGLTYSTVLVGGSNTGTVRVNMPATDEAYLASYNFANTWQGTQDFSGGTVKLPGSVLTTTGTSGPATITGGVLNIPQYSAGPQEIYNTTYTATMTSGTGTLTTLTLAASSGSVQKYRVSVSSSESAAGTGTCTTPGTISLSIGYVDADSGYTVGSINVPAMSYGGITITNLLAATASINANSVWRGLPFDIRAAAGTAVTLTISQQTGSNCTTPPVMKITPYVLSMP
jgi:hypothetical protein